MSCGLLRAPAISEPFPSRGKYTLLWVGRSWNCQRGCESCRFWGEVWALSGDPLESLLSTTHFSPGRGFPGDVNFWVRRGTGISMATAELPSLEPHSGCSQILCPELGTFARLMLWPLSEGS